MNNKPIDTLIDKVILANKINHYSLQKCDEIQMIGVWDTVGALGIPTGAFSGLSRELFEFLNTELNPKVKLGYQALAIDEHRDAFSPSVWQARSGIEQVWFSGDHAGIGGSWPESDLSDITLNWLYQKALAGGVIFTAKPLMNSASNPCGILHNSFTQLYQYIDRPIPTDAAISTSVQQRIVQTPDYIPKNLSYSEDSQLSTSYTLINVEN